MTAEAATGRRFRLPVLYPTCLALAFILLLWTSSGASMFAVPRLLLFTIFVGLSITIVMTLLFRDRDRAVVIRAGSEDVVGRSLRDWDTEGPLRPGPAAAFDPADPDIYLILLDGYLRPDRQASLFGHDASDFIDGLTKRGFQFSDQSRSNYVTTDASLTSMLNFSYLDDLGDQDLRHDIRLRRLLAENRAFKMLADRGYETVAIGGGFDMVALRGAHRFIDTGQISELELVATSRTAIRPLLRVVAPTFLADQARRRVERVLGSAGSLDPGRRPRVVFVHVPSPHDPIVFDGAGRPVAPELEPLDPAQPRTRQSRADFGRRYAGQVDHVGRLTLTTIDRILGSHGDDVAVMLFSDHGSAFDFDWADTSRSDLDERTANLIAVYAPTAQEPQPRSLTLVNSLPILFRRVLHVDVAQQPDRYFRPAPGGALLPFDPEGPALDE